MKELPISLSKQENKVLANKVSKLSLGKEARANNDEELIVFKSILMKLINSQLDQ